MRLSRHSSRLRARLTGLARGFNRTGLRLGSLAFRAGERVADGFNWTKESLFAVVAYLARWIVPLSYAVVRHARNRRRTPIRLKEPFDHDFPDMEIPNRGWPRRAVMAAAMRSDAEFIVLRMRGEQWHCRTADCDRP